MRGLVSLVVLAGCGSSHMADSPPPPPPPAPTAQVFRADVAAPKPATPARPEGCTDENADPYDADVLRTRIAFLAGKALDGRAPGTSGDVMARAFIHERFRCLGLVPFGKDATYALPFTHRKKQTANLAGYLPGADPDVGEEIILVTAHHDHLGNGYLGANDNASGIVAMLAVAEAIAERGTKPKRTIAFVAFGAEESGMVGSYQFAKHPPPGFALDKVVQVVNLDMVGSYASRDIVLAMGAFPKHESRKLLEKLVDDYPELDVSIGGRARGSDYEPFCKKGIPYVFFWTPDKQCYHGKCDTADRIDIPRMIDIASLAEDLVWSLAQSDRDLLAAKTKLGCGA